MGETTDWRIPDPIMLLAEAFSYRGRGLHSALNQNSMALYAKE
jgi:hypothetical protein